MPNGQYILSTATLLVKAADGTEVPVATSEFSDGVEVGAMSALPPLDTVGPTISNLLAPSPKTKGTPVVLTFSEDLDLARATNLVNYLLVTSGRDKKFGTSDDKKVALRSASYNPTARTVTLLPRKKLAASVKYRLTVNGTSASGVEDLAGNLLDGDHDGLVSGNYVDIFKLVRRETPAPVVIGTRSIPFVGTCKRGSEPRSFRSQDVTGFARRHDVWHLDRVQSGDAYASTYIKY